MPTVAEKRRTFRTLHEAGCFVIPNPWDIGSGRYLQSLGFKALATTSSGAAWSLGFADGGVSLDLMLTHIRSIVEASDLPVNADFLNGFADAPEGVAVNVARCVETGVAGLSVEDQITGTERLYDFGLAVERIAAAREAIDSSGGDTLLVARTECFLTGHAEPLKEAIRRLTAFVGAGADVLFAPGVAEPSEIRSIVAAVEPRPVNVLARNLGSLTIADLSDLGVRRVSVGGLLARTAWTGFRHAAEGLKTGSFAAFEGATPGGPLNEFFAADAKRRAG
jgi:2-methylisocitrate lyase-like PEP mutase family enzyme